MKTTCLLLLMLSWAALMNSTSCAAQSQQTATDSSASTASGHPQDAKHAAVAGGGKRQKEGNSSDGRPTNQNVSEVNHPRSQSGLTTANRPKPLSNGGKHFAPESSMHIREAGSGKRNDAVKRGLTQRATINSARPIRPTNVTRPSAPLLNNARHRGANPAVIGGSAISVRNTGAVNGTRVHRKP
jgi:hypothetical protein